MCFWCFCGHFLSTAWGSLSPREKAIYYLYTSSAGSSQAVINLNICKPLPSTSPPTTPLPQVTMDQLTARCCVPRLTIGFRLSLRGHGHVGVLPFVWTHGGILPLHHAAPPQGALGGLGEGRGGNWEGVVMVVMVACRTQHRLTCAHGRWGQDSVHASAGQLGCSYTHTYTLIYSSFKAYEHIQHTHKDRHWAVWVKALPLWPLATH